MTTSFGPCLTDWDPIFCAPIPTGSASASGHLLAAAVETLWQAGGQRYGLCTDTVRPCREECWGGGGWPFGDSWWQWGGAGSWMWPRPMLYAGAWYNITCGGCPGDCSCTALSKFLLPAPIQTIVQIKINGTVMPSGSYKVFDNQKVVRTDGSFWPACQDLTKADTENNTWSVTFTQGELVPEIGKLGLGQLFGEFAKAFCGDDCRLPRNVQSLVRQGVSITVPADEDWLESLTFVHEYLNYANPNRLRGAPRVVNIDATNFTRWGT